MDVFSQSFDHLNDEVLTKTLQEARCVLKDRGGSVHSLNQQRAYAAGRRVVVL